MFSRFSNASSALCRDQRVGVVTFGQEHELELAAIARQAYGVFQRAPGGLPPGAIAVEAKHHLAGQSEYLVEMFLGGRGAEGGHGIGDPGLVQPHDVHISFDDHQAGEIRARLPRFVQPVEFASLVKQRRFRGIEVLGVTLIDDSSAKTDDAPARIPDRKHQPITEAIVKPGRALAAARIALDDEAEPMQLAPLLLLRSKAVEQRIPGIRRVPERELHLDLCIDSTRGHVAPGAVVVSQVLLEKACDPRHHLVQVGAAGVGAPQGLARHLHARALREVRNGVEELHLLVLHEKADHGAVRAAAEAVVELLVGTYPKGRRFLVVEGTTGLEFTACFFQRYPGTDDLDDIGTGDDLVDERLGNAAGHKPARDSTWPKLGFDYGPYLAQVDAALRLALDDGHDLSHVLDAGRARCCDRLSDQGVDLGGTQLGRQVAQQQGDFRSLFLDQILAIAGLELHQRLFALFDHFLKHYQHLGVVENDAFVDFALLDRGGDHADQPEPLLRAGAHRRLHVIGNSLF